MWINCIRKCLWSGNTNSYDRTIERSKQFLGIFPCHSFNLPVEDVVSLSSFKCRFNMWKKQKRNILMVLQRQQLIACWLSGCPGWVPSWGSCPEIPLPCSQMGAFPPGSVTSLNHSQFLGSFGWRWPRGCRKACAGVPRKGKEREHFCPAALGVGQILRFVEVTPTYPC